MENKNIQKRGNFVSKYGKNHFYEKTFLVLLLAMLISILYFIFEMLYVSKDKDNVLKLPLKFTIVNVILILSIIVLVLMTVNRRSYAKTVNKRGLFKAGYVFGLISVIVVSLSSFIFKDFIGVIRTLKSTMESIDGTDKISDIKPGISKLDTLLADLYAEIESLHRLRWHFNF